VELRAGVSVSVRWRLWRLWKVGGHDGTIVLERAVQYISRFAYVHLGGVSES
jgi:hypothetical protein